MKRCIILLFSSCLMILFLLQGGCVNGPIRNGSFGYFRSFTNETMRNTPLYFFPLTFPAGVAVDVLVIAGDTVTIPLVALTGLSPEGVSHPVYSILWLPLWPVICCALTFSRSDRFKSKSGRVYQWLWGYKYVETQTNSFKIGYHEEDSQTYIQALIKGKYEEFYRGHAKIEDMIMRDSGLLILFSDSHNQPFLEMWNLKESWRKCETSFIPSELIIPDSAVVKYTLYNGNRLEKEYSYNIFITCDNGGTLRVYCLKSYETAIPKIEYTRLENSGFIDSALIPLLDTTRLQESCY